MSALHLESDGPPRSIRDLVEAARRGDQQAWSDLYRGYHGLLLSIARAHGRSPAECADAAQAAWTQLVTHIDRLAAPDALGAWLATTTRRECYRISRARRREQLQPAPADGDTPAMTGATADPQDVVVTRLDEARRQRALARAVADLPTAQNRLMRLLLTEGELTYEQISQRLQMPVGSIGPVRRRALDALRAAMAVEAG